METAVVVGECEKVAGLAEPVASALAEVEDRLQVLMPPEIGILVPGLEPVFPRLLATRTRF